MKKTAKPAAFLAGALCANSIPHLATAATGHRHLTPLAGKRSGRKVNLLWGSLNLFGGLALIAGVAGGKGRWDTRLVAFDAGAAVFGAWMAVSETFMKTNTSADVR